jgi:prophage regulatory protein
MERIIKRKEVETITGLSCASIYRKIAAKDFPAQVKLGKNAVGWVESEIQAWIEDKMAKRTESRG